ncbi:MULTISPECIES: hypothetical protein [Hyphomicrobiales]|uniref:hypothetical protein n=1 Tax=Hyphomicrobiales TaxID=356 RepID=UPI000F68D912|nr:MULTISPECIES: hypothetical protein [Hyphomicrobiales]MCQ9147365.1 hypothetical protein [Ochrobactrum sp. BTU2]MDH1270317.1 hypothetical protein [Agrobacterium pusense]MDX4076628.1 hypothetical protein [Brucella sp. NBRC 113783]RSC24738.1 hypothetical protein EGT36_28325 [Agrobacterium sp. FDAARGOS_525]
MAAKSVKHTGEAHELEKAKAIFERVKGDYRDGKNPNSQRRRDADMIVHLLSDGGAARSAVFAETFAELFGIDRKRAGQRVRDAMADLIEAGKIDKTDESRPSYSLRK